MARIGLYPDAPKTPCVVGYEVAGTVARAGRGRRATVSPGQRVLAGTTVRRLRLAGRRPRGRRGRAPGPAQLRAGRRDPRQLRHRLGRADRLRRACSRASACSSTRPAAASASPPRRSPSAAAPRSTAPPRPPSTSASPSSASTTRSTTPRAAGSAGLPQFDVILDAIGGKSFRRSYNLLRPGGRLVAFGASAVVSGEQRNLVTALRTGRAHAALQPRSSRCPNRRPSSG